MSTRLFTLLLSALIGYVLCAFVWWGYLLYERTGQVYDDQIAALASSAPTGTNITALPAYIQSTDKKHRQQVMVVTEGSVFFCLLLLGIFMVLRSHLRLMAVSKQQRNFLLSITHELKSPLASMRLVLDTLVKHNLKVEQTKALASNGVHEAERLQNLIEKMLLAVKVENAALPLDREMMSLTAVVEEAVDTMERKFSDHRFVMKEQEEPLAIRADLAAVESIVTNLLENAVKYSPKGSTITTSLKSDGRFAVLSVADEGMGIPDAEKQHIFQRFYRIGNEDTRLTKGTGLGLYIVQQLVRLHQGAIQVRDNMPCGTVFTVQLPCASEALQLSKAHQNG